MNSTGLNRFLEAQDSAYKIAFEEISNGLKQSHWMWYIFPQLKGLGVSDTAKYYGIEDINEAIEYLNHPTLGPRLVQITSELTNHANKTAHQIFGSPDDLKLHSCLTLFSALPDAPPIFEQIIAQFFDGMKDHRTLQILDKD